MRLLDLFAGSCAVSKVFAARGWTGVCVDLKPMEPPEGFDALVCDALSLTVDYVRKFDFAWASSPCENFSVFGMRMFHPDPPYPTLGIELFNHTREIFWKSGVPWVMENVRAAQDFVGQSKHNCGPFHLWGTGVPPLMPQGIKKGFKLGTGELVRRLRETSDKTALVEFRKKMDCWHSSKSPQRIANTAKVATIPMELANCVADYAERLLEQRPSETRSQK